MQPLIGHDLMKTDFENPEVLNAANPSDWGYHHGAHVLCTCLDYADYDSCRSVLQSKQPEQDLESEWLNACNVVTNIYQAYVDDSRCWAAISGDQMCGMVFSESSAYWRHVRTKHEAKSEQT